MSGISTEYSEKYPQATEIISRKYPQMQILSAKDCLYPLQKQKVRYTVTSVKKAELLEEYIMKAAMLALTDGTNIALLSKMLGMDEIFLTDCIDSLCDRGILKKESLPLLELTESGKRHAASGTVPSDEILDDIEYFIDKKSGLFYTAPIENPSCEIWENYKLVEQYVENIKKYISRKFICDVGTELGKEIEDSGGTTRITSVVSAKITGQAHTLITEFILENSDSEKLYLIWDHAKSAFRNDLSEIMKKYMAILNK